MIPELEIPFDRVTWRDGQPLTSRDLTDEKTRKDRMRWLHNRYLHDGISGNWGISSGFVATVVAGGSSIGVTAGYAIDRSGRDLLLTENVAVPVPEVTAPKQSYLVARYQDDAAFRARRRVRPACQGTPLDPRNERPSFAWVDSSDWRNGREVAIAAVLIAPGSTTILPTSVRRYVRAQRRLRAASGVTGPAATIWTRPSEGSVYIETRVQTEAAGFVRRPCYFASLRRGSTDVIAPGVTYIDSADASGFVFRVLTGFGWLGFPTGISQATQGGWHVSWFAVEPAAPPPAISSYVYLHLAGYSIAP
jgi:hypothetical protein